MYIKILLLFVISFGVSESVFSSPDLSNPLIPLRSRLLCGYRNRPYSQKISHNNKCFMQSFEEEMAFNPLIERFPNQSTPNTRIGHGVNAQYGEAPWSVQLGVNWKNRFRFLCSAVLVTDRHILTNAHCFKDEYEFYIFIGGYTPLSGYTTNKFKFFKHPDYENITHWHSYDIAIIVLDEPIEFAWYDYLESHSSSKHFQMNPICLPLPEKYVPEDDATLFQFQKATMFGWGGLINERKRTWLQRADMDVKYSDKGLLQFASREDVWPQACGGDSGSGLVQYLDEHKTRAVLIGIMSSSSTRPGTEPTCNRVRQTYFIRVANVLDWIYDRLEKDYSNN